MENTNTKLGRFLASLINWILVIPIFINIVFWFLDKEPIGQKLFKTEGFQGKPKGERAVFGLLTFVIFVTVVGLLVNIYFWWNEKDSIPVMLTKKIFKDSSNTTMPEAKPTSAQPSASATARPASTPTPAKPAPSQSAPSKDANDNNVPKN